MTTPAAYSEALALVTTALGVEEGNFGREVLVDHVGNLLTEVSPAEFGNLLLVLAEYGANAVKLVAETSGRSASDLHRNIALATAEAIHFSPPKDPS